ncbi:hypothetical protein Rs2_38130 [Raphanus sativus]|nr:hypothetical protein Rs2_38130 [Raphanus sativus]
MGLEKLARYHPELSDNDEDTYSSCKSSSQKVLSLSFAVNKRFDVFSKNTGPLTLFQHHSSGKWKCESKSITNSDEPPPYLYQLLLFSDQKTPSKGRYNHMVHSLPFTTHHSSHSHSWYVTEMTKE